MAPAVPRRSRGRGVILNHRSEIPRGHFPLWDLWQSVHEPWIALSDLPVASASFFSTAASTALVFSLYFLASVSQDALSPLGGLFLPSASPKTFSALACVRASSHLPPLASFPICARNASVPLCPSFMIVLMSGTLSAFLSWP